MRVLLAHNRYRIEGGEERHIALLEQGLEAAGVEVRRFERDSGELDRSRLKRFTGGLALTYRPGGGGIGHTIEEWRPDVVHFHNIWPGLTPAAIRIARRSGAVVVLTAHNYRFACPGGTLLRSGSIHEDCIEGSSFACALHNPRGAFAESLAYGIAIEIHRRLRFLVRWVDAFIAPSSFMSGILVRSGLPANRVHVIHHGLSTISEPSVPGRYALFIGRLSEEKGVRTLLEAARQTPEVPVLLAGAGPLVSLVQSTSAVTHVGRLDQRGIRDAISGAAYTVIPSEWYENLPFAALESLAFGKPVIATRMGGLSEIVEDGVSGLLVPAKSPARLADAMRRLWTSPDLVRMLGANALARASRDFSLVAQTDKVIALYESLRASRSGRTDE